jgi:long-chain acyl-CoA synthetase
LSPSHWHLEVCISPKFETEYFLRDIQNFAISHIYIVPTMMIRLLKLPLSVREQYDTSSLKFAISTGSQCSAEVNKAMIAWFGPIFYEFYGASEIGFMTLISSVEALSKPGSVGKVLPGGTIKILDQDKQECKIGESGLIYIDLPQFGAFRYTNAEGDFNEIHLGSHTTVGDIGYVDENGYLFINDRQKDMVISGGVNILPTEIEAQLIKMSEIADCAVFGAPHTEFGEMLVAALVCKYSTSLSLEQVHAFLDAKLAKFKFPQKLDLHTQLPREDSGKIFKPRLKQVYQKGS